MRASSSFRRVISISFSCHLHERVLRSWKKGVREERWGIEETREKER